MEYALLVFVIVLAALSALAYHFLSRAISELQENMDQVWKDQDRMIFRQREYEERAGRHLRALVPAEPEEPDLVGSADLVLSWLVQDGFTPRVESRPGLLTIHPCKGAKMEIRETGFFTLEVEAYGVKTGKYSGPRQIWDAWLEIWLETWPPTASA